MCCIGPQLHYWKASRTAGGAQCETKRMRRNVRRATARRARPGRAVVGCTLSAARCRLHVVCCTLGVAARGRWGRQPVLTAVPEGTRKINARARPPASTHGVWVHRVRRPCGRQVLNVQHTTAHVHRKACSLQRATRSRRHTCNTYQTTENMQHAARNTQHALCAERTVR